MARENQGLQIALIVFVMLTIILGVTTYLFFRQYEEADIKARNNLAERDKKARDFVKAEDEVNELKRLIGVAKTEKLDAITTNVFGEDMKKYGSSYPEEVRFYRPLLEKMQQTINDKNGKLAQAEDKIKKLETDFAVRETNKQPQLEKFEQEAKAARADLDSERSKFQADRDRITQEESKLKSDLEGARKESAAALVKIEQKFQDAFEQNKKLLGTNRTLSDKLQETTSAKFEVSQGEVRWVNQQTGTVWIDLGRADALYRQITFGVYPANVAEATGDARKASIEVTQIVGEHLAEARIIDDNSIDPILPGDKLFTPIWTPGEKRHFALAGFMDVTGDGKNDVQAVKDLIALNGGVVDSYIDDKGKRVGDMTINTRYLVLGEAPTEKGQSATIAAFSKMRTDAERLGVQKVQLTDLLARMGWKNQMQVVQYGRGANIKDFGAKADVGAQKKSTGNVSDVFQRREPPSAPSGGGSYYKFRM